MIATAKMKMLRCTASDACSCSGEDTRAQLVDAVRDVLVEAINLATKADVLAELVLDD